MVTAGHRWSQLAIDGHSPCAECDHRAFPRPDQARDQGRQVLGAEKVTTLTSHVSRVTCHVSRVMCHVLRVTSPMCRV